LITWHYILSAELTKNALLQTVFLAILLNIFAHYECISYVGAVDIQNKTKHKTN